VMPSVPARPGDFACVPVHGEVGRLIAFGEKLNGDKAFGKYQHALIYMGDGKVLQAEPGGARIVSRHWQPGDLWSTEIIDIPDAARARVPDLAQRFVGVPYSALDYFALAAHRLSIPVPGLRGYIASTGHMICSQLVDEFMLELGVHLFRDGRWPGYVTPAALAGRLLYPEVH
jgi:hypothetical protein